MSNIEKSCQKKPTISMKGFVEYKNYVRFLERKVCKDGMVHNIFEINGMDFLTSTVCKNRLLDAVEVGTIQEADSLLMDVWRILKYELNPFLGEVQSANKMQTYSHFLLQSSIEGEMSKRGKKRDEDEALSEGDELPKKSSKPLISRCG
ncbi:Uncharacterized protein Fot_26786 [Forsythia ovata]|uniref:Uncharacterized protein n=1 Tax=Forsythia ovata TaxID=205694 RepID=A0ABD1UDP7_9LAMI